MPQATAQIAPPSPPAPPRTAPAEHHDENAIPKDLPHPGPITIIAVTVILILLLGGIFLVGWFPHNAERAQADADATQEAQTIPVVTVAPPTKSAPTSELALPCDVRTFQETSIFPRTSGYLKKLYVDIQSRVKAGDVLAEIDSPEIDAQLAQARGALEQANAGVVKSQAQFDFARRTLDRYRELQNFPNNVLTPQEFEQIENSDKQASGGVAQAKADADAAQAAVDRFITLQKFEKVLAPFDGVITARQYDVGALLSATDTAPGKEMFHIAEIDKLRVYVSVPQVYAGDVKVGEPAILNVTTHPGDNFQGVVALSASAVDQATRTMLFELDFPNKDGRLYAGMYGTAKLQLTHERPVLLVPTAALRFDASGVHVAIVKDGKVHFQEVQTGSDLGTSLEIVSGLSPDDQVVSNPNERITEGASVKTIALAKPAPATAPAPPLRQASAR